jgi:hypothetical protein
MVNGLNREATRLKTKITLNVIYINYATPEFQSSIFIFYQLHYVMNIINIHLCPIELNLQL